MGDTTGPIRSLPGTPHDLPEGATCEWHPERPAVTRIQGETDSMGCELIDMCQECFDEHMAYIRSDEARTGRCDWCKADATDLRDTRDYDEGLCGPVYRVCGTCRQRRDEQAEADLDYYYDRYSDGGLYD